MSIGIDAIVGCNHSITAGWGGLDADRLDSEISSMTHDLDVCCAHVESLRQITFVAWINRGSTVVDPPGAMPCCEAVGMSLFAPSSPLAQTKQIQGNASRSAASQGQTRSSSFHSSQGKVSSPQSAVLDLKHLTVRIGSQRRKCDSNLVHP